MNETINFSKQNFQTPINSPIKSRSHDKTQKSVSYYSDRKKFMTFLENSLEKSAILTKIHTFADKNNSFHKKDRYFREKMLNSKSSFLI